MTRRVLVTGGRAPAALDWVRTLAREGWTVFLGDSFRFTMSGFSKYAQRVYRLPEPRTESSAFRSTVKTLIEELALDLVLPTCEEVFYLADLHPVVFCPSLELLRKLHSKWTFLSCAQDCGVSLPQSRLAHEFEELPPNPDGYVFKREFSRFSEGTTVGAFPKELPCVVQERLRGEELSGYGVAIQGVLKAWSLYRPLHRLGAASSIYFRPLHCPRARSFAEVFVKKWDFHGQLAFDFIRSGSELFALECNPRATSGVHLFGGNLSRVFRGEEVPSVPKDRYLGPTVPLALSRELWKDMTHAQEVVGVPGDRGPLLGAALHTAEALCRSVMRVQSVKAAMTRDLEWDGEPYER